MKLYSQVSVLFGAVLAFSTALVSAETIQLGSYASQTGVPNLYGNNNTAVAFVGSGSPSTTYALNPGTVWAQPVGNSVWVSNNPGSGPGGSVTESAGIYKYTTTFTTMAGETYTGSIQLLADDTADVWFNGTSLIGLGLIGSDARCADSGPNCRAATTIMLPSDLFVAGGVNTLQFDLQQTIASTGLDFYGTATGTPVGGSVIPEPGTLFLLGTGLIGSAGILLRRFQGINQNS